MIRVEKVHVSHYMPWRGGANCGTYVNGECISNMASGRPWKPYINKAAACVKEWPFGTRFRLPDGRIFICLDRGGAIRYGYKYNDGLAWVDLLTANPGYKYGEVVQVEILK